MRTSIVVMVSVALTSPAFAGEPSPDPSERAGVGLMVASSVSTRGRYLKTQLGVGGGLELRHAWSDLSVRLEAEGLHTSGREPFGVCQAFTCWASDEWPTLDVRGLVGIGRPLGSRTRLGVSVGPKMRRMGWEQFSGSSVTLFGEPDTGWALTWGAQASVVLDVSLERHTDVRLEAYGMLTGRGRLHTDWPEAAGRDVRILGGPAGGVRITLLLWPGA